MTKKEVFVFGGTRGIGKVFVEQAEKEGYSLSIFARTAMEKNSVDSIMVDFCDSKTLRKVVAMQAQKCGKIDNMIFCQRYRGNNLWDGEIATSLEATKIAIEESIPFFSKNASIVIIGSNGGRFVATEQPIEYAIAKAGLEQLVRYYAVKLGPLGVKVNAVSPAVTLKPENEEFYHLNPTLINLYSKVIPLNRMGTAEDICEAIFFLMNTSFITGQTIVVDGGISLQTHDSLAKLVAGIDDIHLIHPIK